MTNRWQEIDPDDPTRIRQFVGETLFHEPDGEHFQVFHGTGPTTKFRAVKTSKGTLLERWDGAQFRLVGLQPVNGTTAELRQLAWRYR